MLNSALSGTLKNSPLFSGLKHDEIRAFLNAAAIHPRTAETGDCLINQGEAQTDIYILLTGAAHGEKLTADGRLFTVNTFQPGDIFGDVLSGATEKSPVTVRMAEAGKLIAIPFSALLRGTDALAQTRERILRNLINEIAAKYFALLRRTNLLTSPTLRGKIAIYLLEESKNSKNAITVPHSREEQARLFGCDRSALSRELSRMKTDGIINFHGRKFELLDMQALRNLSQ